MLELECYVHLQFSLDVLSNLLILLNLGVA